MTSRNDISQSGNPGPRLSQCVRDHDPTAIVLAFCWTAFSLLNRGLRAEGVFGKVIVREERAKITAGNCLTLDPVQEDLIRRISEENPRNVFLWGGSGTGKTLVLAQALDIMLSRRQKQNLSCRIVVTTGDDRWNCPALMDEYRSKYCRHIIGDQVGRGNDRSRLDRGQKSYVAISLQEDPMRPRLSS